MHPKWTQRSRAVAALTQALTEVRTYIDTCSTEDERIALVGLEPDLHELARRFEYLTKEDGD